VVQTSTFVFESSAEMRRYLEGDSSLYLYTRYENPTLRALEQTLATLEGGEDALVLASGMAACSTALFSLLEAGDEVIGSTSLYGGTTRLIRDVLPRFGVAGRLLPPSDLTRIHERASPRTRVLMIESPTNPTLEVLDIEAVAASAQRCGITLVVDNTFATPVLQRPLRLGAHLVMHSLTKAMGGHSDLIGGALVGSADRVAKARALMKVLGGCLDPHAAALVLRGLKTLPLRVLRQSETALAIAGRLADHPKVDGVNYPGLPTHPGHRMAGRQMAAFGGMMSFVVKGGLPAAERFYDRLRLVARAASLGGVESLVSLPVHTSHHGFTNEQLAAAGIDPGLVRLSVGVEDAADLIADLLQALAGA
jgi:cystathionine beta-lyase/cystathionine gamma-synthase